jgi:hypothetical protein
VRVGSWVHIEQVQASVQTNTGPVTPIIDVRVWVEIPSNLAGSPVIGGAELGE